MSRRACLVGSALCQGLLLAIGGGCTGSSGPGNDADGTEATSASSASSSGSSGSTGEPEGWVTILNVGTEVGAFMSVWGPTPGEVYVAGGQPEVDGTPSVGVIQRFDGMTWTPEVLPAGTPMLNWIHGVQGELWSVGLNGAAVVRATDSWNMVATGTTETLWGIWGSSVDDLWAVGGDGLAGPNVLLHWDGSIFTPELAPALDATESSGLFKVWGSATDDVMVVGDKGVMLRGMAGAWSLAPSQTAGDLIALWGTGADEILVVGGRSSARLVRWDGTAWTEALPMFPGLNGVWMDASGTATAVGNSGTILRLPPGSLEAEREVVGTGDVLHAVHGFEGGPRFAVGGTILGPPPFTGLVVRNAAP